MSIKVAINGFGRMGRLGVRAGWDMPELEFVHINEIATGAGDRRTCSNSIQFTAHGITTHLLKMAT